MNSNDAIKAAQAAYADSSVGASEYKALVEEVAFRVEITLAEAYILVEEGPVIY